MCAYPRERRGGLGVECSVAGGREGPSTGAENQTVQGHYGLSWQATSPASVDGFLSKDQVDKAKLTQTNKSNLRPQVVAQGNVLVF